MSVYCELTNAVNILNRYLKKPLSTTQLVDIIEKNKISKTTLGGRFQFNVFEFLNVFLKNLDVERNLNPLNLPRQVYFKPDNVYNYTLKALTRELFSDYILILNPDVYDFLLFNTKKTIYVNDDLYGFIYNYSISRSFDISVRRDIYFVLSNLPDFLPKELIADLTVLINRYNEKYISELQSAYGFNQIIDKLNQQIESVLSKYNLTGDKLNNYLDHYIKDIEKYLIKIGKKDLFLYILSFIFILTGEGKIPDKISVAYNKNYGKIIFNYVDIKREILNLYNYVVKYFRFNKNLNLYTNRSNFLPDILGKLNQTGDYIFIVNPLTPQLKSIESLKGSFNLGDNIYTRYFGTESKLEFYPRAFLYLKIDKITEKPEFEYVLKEV